MGENAGEQREQRRRQGCMGKTTVSVIVPTYRRSESLARALESLANQSYQDFEIIVVDDNGDEKWNQTVSTIVDSFRVSHPSISLQLEQNHPNQGSAKSRNIGIDLSQGEYITFLDDDDLYLPDKIRNQLNAMIESEADYSIMDLSLYYENESLSEIRTRDYLLDPKEKNNLLLCHLKYHLTGTDTMMFRTSYIRSFGGFEAIDVGDEFYLMLKAIKAAGTLVYCKTCDVKAYVHTGEGGLSSGQQKIDGEKRLFAFKKRFLKDLAFKDRRYIKMRFYAVLAFAYKRSNKRLMYLISGIKAVCTAPIQSILLVNRIRLSKKRIAKQK